MIARAGVLLAVAVLALAVRAEPLPPTPANAVPFTPPAPDTIPDSPLGEMIRFGLLVFTDTQRYAKPYVGNRLNCVNCHLDAGRLAGSAPLWGAYVAYPAFRKRGMRVDTFEQRIDSCFRYSMNGRPPPADGAVIAGLSAYSFWLATGAPVGAHLVGRGFPEVTKPPLPPSVARGEHVYTAHCALCHQATGEGVPGTFPPVWGNGSYNKGAGMYHVPTAAAFIKANMPLGQGNTLSDQEAWDVAAYINSKPRPPNPGGARTAGR